MAALAVCGLPPSPYDPHGEGEGEGGGGRGEGGGKAGKTGEGGALPEGSFFFGNVLPSAQGARLRVLREVVAPAAHPCVFYELPRRLLAVLQDIAAVLPRRRVYVAHELTKLNESLHSDTAERLVNFYLRQEAQMMLKKGQLVLVVAGAGAAETAAWLDRETRKRRRLRREVKELLAIRPSPPNSPSSSPDDASAGGNPDQLPRETKEPPARVSRKARRRMALKRRREKLIRDIEKEQERLRLNLSINRASTGNV
ncbi:unnamed protein product [Phytomonas sp. EM1]|nr:unnamed protein product [Phytomonas sp. EM1]|eukprot:CCW62170.1 unnamed protein product [Phytomonas sp. isolate EM1]